MARSRASAKAAGSTFERLIADFLARVIDDRIDRRVKTGAADKGDIGGLRHFGHRLVVECKDYAGKLLPAQWVKEAQLEAENDNALAGIVIAKRRGTTNPEEQWVLMTVAELVLLLTAHERKTDATKEDR